MNKSDAVFIFTDGSSVGNPGPAGWAAVLEWNGHSREISGHLDSATNNVAELTAILMALRALKHPVSVVLHTDSKYCIGVLTQNWKIKANHALIDQIKELIRVHEFHIVYTSDNLSSRLRQAHNLAYSEAHRE